MKRDRDREACCVIVIVRGNRKIDPSLNPRWDGLHFHIALTSGKVWIQLISPSILTLLCQPFKEKDNSEFKPVQLCLNLMLCHTLLVWSDWVYIYIYIYHPPPQHHHRDVLQAPISLKSCCRLVLVGHPKLAHPCEGVYRRMLLMCSSLLLQQTPECLISLIWMVLEI